MHNYNIYKQGLSKLGNWKIFKSKKSLESYLLYYSLFVLLLRVLSSFLIGNTPQIRPNMNFGKTNLTYYFHNINI